YGEGQKWKTIINKATQDTGDLQYMACREVSEQHALLSGTSTITLPPNKFDIAIATRHYQSWLDQSHCVRRKGCAQDPR
ncbi:hypothetical protein JYT79_03625, partial [Cardiobacterium sp. AH-315-I02]|nr:hypothetical protein [Cardiobacterium sp. AH-315-I02]